MAQNRVCTGLMASAVILASTNLTTHAEPLLRPSQICLQPAEVLGLAVSHPNQRGTKDHCHGHFMIMIRVVGFVTHMLCVHRFIYATVNHCHTVTYGQHAMEVLVKRHVGSTNAGGVCGRSLMLYITGAQVC